METSKTYVITGAPGTGKSTLTNLLKEEFSCLDEISRKVIIEEQQAGGSGMPWLDVEKFAARVYEATLPELARTDRAVFCDRSLLDMTAYLLVAGKPVPPCLENFPYSNHYHSVVFLAPVWEEIHKEDEQRPQSVDYCRTLEKELVKVYRQKGFQVITLPKTSPEKRMDFIKNNLPQLRSIEH